MQANEYQELALRTKAPNGRETFMRFVASAGTYHQAITKLHDCLADCDFDNLKRLIYYAPPGTNTGSPLSEEEDSELSFMHGLFGFLSECFELHQIIMEQEHIDPVHLMEELGDLLWYINLMASSHGIKLADVMDRNIAKLSARYPDKFTEYNAKIRDLKKEREVLEGSDGSRMAKHIVSGLSPEYLSQKQKEQLSGY